MARFISTSIPFVNGSPHLGHALEYVQADAMARYWRLRGHDVFFLTGSDENSLKNVLAAEAEGLSPEGLVARNVGAFQDLLGVLAVTHDHFIRTSVDPEHFAGATRLWELLDAAGDIYAKAYRGLYCVGCEQFYTPEELLPDGRCPEHLTVPEEVEETNWFFRLSRYGPRLLELIEGGELVIRPDTRRNEVLQFLRAGAEDISISRSAERARGWGVPVPGDQAQVMYVWIDALANYITGLGWADEGPRWQRYWRDAEVRTHVIGKGITRFHAVYWPAMLLSAGVALPTDLLVHGYLTANGQKISKSLGNAVAPAGLAERYGPVPLRWSLLAHCPTFTDGDFSEARMVAGYHDELANGLGNLASRVTAMLLRYRDGVVPSVGDPDAAASGLRAAADEALAQWDEDFEGRDPRQAAQAANTLVRRANAYLDETAPWHLAKDDAQAAALDASLAHAAAAVRRLAVLFLPFVPEQAAGILESLGQDPGGAGLDARWLEGLSGVTVTKAHVLFPRLELDAA